MKYRKLRIAWSVACGILCLLLVVLWVRSYGHSDSLPVMRMPSGKWTRINSSQGRISISTVRTPEWWKNARKRSTFVPGKGYSVAGESGYFDSNGLPLGAGGMPAKQSTLPNWSCVIGVLAIAAIPWVGWSFSLRTLLIAMTLVAVALGLIVWAANRVSMQPHESF
jgi:hypothetical protein